MSEDRERWIASSYKPESAGWYWVWNGYPKDPPCIALITLDHLGYLSWSCGIWSGRYTEMADRFPWRWSCPIPLPGGRDKTMV